MAAAHLTTRLDASAITEAIDWLRQHQERRAMIVLDTEHAVWRAEPSYALLELMADVDRAARER